MGTVLYIPHGGGPLPLLGDPGHRNMVEFMKRLPREIPTPTAILVISAHWEADHATITGGAAPPLIYDYSGFPEESYRITYPAPGDPRLAEETLSLLTSGGIDARLDPDRGFDHGLFVPLKLSYPDANIPCVQLSLFAGLDPSTHLRIGTALHPLRQKEILVLGSGFSFHNMRAFLSGSGTQPDQRNNEFQEWLKETCTSDRISREEREDRLVHWEDAPHARYCHPREEHLIPLHVCCGMTGAAGEAIFDGEVLGKRALGILWQ